MSFAHPTSQLLRDLKRHVETVVPGSEPFASGLKAVADTAWEIVQLRNVDWSALGQQTEYVFKVRTFEASVDGMEETYRTLDKAPAPPVFTPYQKTQRKFAERVLNQWGHHCTWVSQKFADALNSDKLNGRENLRCLKGKASHEATTDARIEEIKQRMVGAKVADKRVADFIARHGGVIMYRDSLYPNAKEALAAMRADCKALPVDHDLVVMMFEDAFPEGHNGIVEDKLAALESYLRSKDHRDARDLSKQIGVPERVLTRYDKTLKMVINAERKLAALDEPLPPHLYRKLGVSKSFLQQLMVGQERNKATVRAALREKLYQLSPQRRPRGKRTPNPTTV